MNPTPLTIQFRLFLQERPSINSARLAEELGIDRVNFGKIILGTRNIPRHRQGQFHRMMVKYGYREITEPDSDASRPSDAVSFQGVFP